MLTLKQFDAGRPSRFLMGALGGYYKQAILFEALTRKVFVASPTGITAQELLDWIVGRTRPETRTAANIATATENLQVFLDDMAEPTPDGYRVLAVDDAGRYTYAVDGGRDPQDPDIGHEKEWPPRGWNELPEHTSVH